MKISGLIKRFQNIQEKKGDLEVWEEFEDGSQSMLHRFDKRFKIEHDEEGYFGIYLVIKNSK